MFGAFSSLADLDDQDDAHDAFHNDKVVSETSRDTRNSYLVLGYNGSILPEFVSGSFSATLQKNPS